MSENSVPQEATQGRSENGENGENGEGGEACDV